MNTRNTLVMAAITASLAAVNAGAIEDPDTDEHVFDIPGIEISRPKEQQDTLPSPGLYLAEPYSLVVIAPEPVDPAFEHKLGHNTQMDDFIIRPPGHLKPYRPAK